MIKGFIIKLISICLMVWISVHAVGCSRESIQAAKKITEATTQAASNPIVIHSYPPASEGISGAVTGVGMIVMQVLNTLERRAERKHKNGG